MIRKIRLFPPKTLFKRSPAKEVIEKDINRWVQDLGPTRFGYSILENLAWLLDLYNHEEFRNLFYYRLGVPSNIWDSLLLALTKMLYKPRRSLQIISPAIGPSFMIKHGHGTIIQAEKIGENCMIFQEVVIGFKDGTRGLPTLGNHVHVGSGAKILGPVTIGDNVDVVANAVVTKDIPSGRAAIGVPAQTIMNPRLVKKDVKEV